MSALPYVCLLCLNKYHRPEAALYTVASKDGPRCSSDVGG
jgi:hypothetical protein